MKKFVVTAATISFMLLFLFFSSSQNETVTLYKNDTKFTNYPEYPAETVNDELYVPIYFFLNIPDVRYEYIPSTGGFYLVNKLNGYYLSYIPTSTQICLTGEVFAEKEFPLLNSTRYLPLQFAADALGLSVETRESGTKVRLCDTSAQLSFEELIELFDPTPPASEDTTPPSEDTPPPSTPNDEPNDLTPPIPVEPEPEDKYIYLTFEDCPDKNTDAILDVLNRYGIKAVFFCEKEKIYEYPKTVIQIVSEGHTLGLHAASENQSSLTASLSGTVKEITNTNLALMTVVNQKSRLWRFPEGTDGKFIDQYVWQNVLDLRGYIVWDWNVDSCDSQPNNSKWDIYYYSKVGIDKNETSYIRFTCSDNTAAALDILLEYITSNSNMHIMTVDETTTEYNFCK